MAKAGTAARPAAHQRAVRQRPSKAWAVVQPNTPWATSHTSWPSELFKVTTAGGPDGAGITAPSASYHCRTGRTA